ncbi:hypothetical protein J4461_03635 [Candidatus Pacearchaeota archaeon]|nr:hypothetical protein [uncultured archaeon]AQS34033.1 hypothetical protein [uncultured archaeon]AQS34082.1 hypothetical protein [uncultured archaeon]MBS3089943.1 hypothetical protein [Candidatus Pacearchaeota archaeon]
MEYIYLVPVWFFGFSIAMEVVFAFVTIIVASYALRIYKLSAQRESMLLGVSFLLIAFSYILKAITNLVIMKEISEGIRGANLTEINVLGSIGLYGYLFLFTAGLMTLAYMTLKTPNMRAYSLLLLLALTALILSQNKVLAFAVLSTVLLAYISTYYIIQYSRKKNPKTLLILASFVGLLISGFGLFGVPALGNKYVIGHILELVSYLFILASLVLATRKKNA